MWLTHSLSAAAGILPENCKELAFSGNESRHKLISPRKLHQTFHRRKRHLVHRDEIRSKMKANGFRSGFTCLFYGEPGTGKTETVYQIARECGRAIYIVDVSQIKSCWVGESEKNIKKVH